MISGVWLVILFILSFSLLLIYIYIKQLIILLDNIVLGNLNVRFNLPAIGKIGGLILGVKKMVQKLKILEKQNQELWISDKSKVETLVSVLTDAAILLDQELRVNFFNPAAIEMFKLFKNCITGLPIFYYLPHYLNIKLIPILDDMFNTNSFGNIQVSSQQTFVVFDHKTAKTLRFILTTIVDQQKKFFIGIVIVIQDITKELEISEFRGQFISNISHELRTPLFNIQSFLETLLDYNHILTNKQKIEFLTIASHETTRLTCLVNDILDLSRLESNFYYSMDYVDLETIVNSVIQVSQIRAYNRKIQLIFQLDLTSLIIKGSYNLLVQVLSNLVGNALKFTELDSRIIVKVYLVTVNIIQNKFKKKCNKVRIEIIDEGKGIEYFDQSRVFDRFVHIENGVHTIDSTGLGLSIVKKIIERHNSHIYLYSELNIGSSFWFDLFLSS